MSDLISRSTLIEILKKSLLYTDGTTKMTTKIIIEEIENQPPVEAVPVVHCKDCKNWHEETGWCNRHSHFIDYDGDACHPWESNDWKMFYEDDFCSDGERKENVA